jgi:hypothetical protein
MVLDVLAIALFLGVRWVARRYSAPDPTPPQLPFEDLPPVTAPQEHPRGRRLTGYVEHGFHEIDRWLHHRDEAAPPAPRRSGGDPVNP